MRATELSVKRTVKERTIRRGGRVMYRLVESTSDFILEKPLNDQAVSSLDLAIATGMSH